MFVLGSRKTNREKEQLTSMTVIFRSKKVSVVHGGAPSSKLLSLSLFFICFFSLRFRIACGEFDSFSERGKMGELNEEGNKRGYI